METDFGTEIRSGLLGSYNNGIINGLTEAQITILQIMNAHHHQLTADELMNRFMGQIQAKIEKINLNKP